ncbi:hypothetical protein GCM10025867_43280 [Frondihabitans sucicola]|uniref:FAD-dependent urate hydroxylase HpyO/Asp monooxygenase CreE-like FAD/NAD(P)-binding domain-containing protein n=1 Tax=Frondihabitans sucicola TaxID=1268041 RepID=A0ABM8GUD0_9MICO|nr:FAD/NAD(P)-binding protein [Frondihabitans sucicola]BDZ52087.1 hypothetical protein GCM10025867_43280 [Frondihabitans sucicola]
MSSSESSVVIVGGGAAAVFATFALRDRSAALGLPALHVTVVGREPVVGRGLAYGRAEPHHRLNSPAGKMSLSATDDEAFLRWLDRAGWRDVDGTPADAGSYVPRRVFGDYVESQFAGLLASSPTEVTFLQGEVVGILPSSAGVTVALADGSSLTAESAVLALGNPAPGTVATGAARSLDDPWAPGALDGVTASDRVLLVGTGLTMIDVATSLARRMPGVRLTATSRRLLLPAVHLPEPAAAGPGLGDEVATLGEMISAFGAQLRAAKGAGSPWQAVLDGVRPQVQTLWQRLSVADRRRFLDHVARRWDVHRHRMAQAVWAEVSALIESGALTLSPSVAGTSFDVAINCTGPASVASRGWSRLVDALLDAGLVAPDPTGIGFDTDASGALVDSSGVPSDRLFAIGAALKGALWETVAIPEVRQLAYRIADRLASPEDRRFYAEQAI